jgi:hypothetical protein
MLRRVERRVVEEINLISAGNGSLTGFGRIQERSEVQQTVCNVATIGPSSFEPILQRRSPNLRNYLSPYISLLIAFIS